MKTIAEKFLLYRIRAKNDPDAFGQIYDAYARRIYRFISYKVAQSELAEDLTSDAFLKAWQYLKEESRRVESLQALLYSVARSVVADHYRSAARAAGDVRIDDEDAAELPDLDSDKILREVETHMDAALVAEHLRHLPDHYREVLVMKYLDQLDTAEIAAVLQKSRPAVRVLLHRSIQALQRAISHVQEPAKNPSLP